MKDSARFPYGPKPVEEIRRYARDRVLPRGPGREVARDRVQLDRGLGDRRHRRQRGHPGRGGGNPGARAAIQATRNGIVGVIGTEATIATGAYQPAMGSAVILHAAACPAFVDHVERGDTSPMPCAPPRAGILSHS